MTIWKVVVLAFIQGFAELLPISSSAHVVVAEKLMGLDPSAPQMTLLLVMLHTGTMFAVLVYFWKTWRQVYFSTGDAFRRFAILAIWATLLTAIVGELLKKLIEKTLFRGAPKAQIEDLFSHLELIAPALAVVGVLIIVAGLLEKKMEKKTPPRVSASGRRSSNEGTLALKQAGWMGLIQGLALPFRGFSRSGSTISTGMLAGAAKEPAERFSFALAVILTPPVVFLEALRLVRAAHASAAHASAAHASAAAGAQIADPINLHAAVAASLLGGACSFVAGLLALAWLSRWLESGKWRWFGIYCLLAAAGVFYLHTRGF